MSRRPYRSRQYLYACPKCHQWHAVPTLEVQAQCRTAGACPRCQHDAAWLARVKIAAIEEHMTRLVTLGTAAPESDKARYRAMYVKKQQQLAAAKSRLEALTLEEVSS